MTIIEAQRSASKAFFDGGGFTLDDRMRDSISIALLEAYRSGLSRAIETVEAHTREA